MAVLPLFHVFAMTAVMNVGLATGAELILLPRFVLGQCLKTLVRRKATLFPAVPTIYAAIAKEAERTRCDLSSIRFCVSGGAPLSSEVRHDFERTPGPRRQIGTTRRQRLDDAAANRAQPGNGDPKRLRRHFAPASSTGALLLPIARNFFTLRAAWRMRCSFSTSATRT